MTAAAPEVPGAAAVRPSVGRAGSRPTPSLATRLLGHALLVLLGVWAIGAVIAIAAGGQVAEQTFDRSLLDDAYAIGSHVERQASGLTLRIDEDVVEAVLFDQNESMYYAVIDDAGLLLAGDRGLETARQPSPDATVAFSTLERDGQRLRAVVLQQADLGFRVVIAQTTRARTEQLQRLVAYSVLPQGLLLLLGAWVLRRIVRADLAPLAALQHALDQRDAADLTPLPVPLAGGVGSREIERVRTALDALLGRVADGVRAQREFAGNVAHELRTPLAGIRALAEYGLVQRDPDVLREQLRRVVESQDRASHLVDQLLALALADEGGASVARVPTRLDLVAREVLLRFVPRADQAGVDLGGSGLDRPVTVQANASLLEGLLGNLLDNALRHGRRAAGELSIVTLELAMRDGAAVLAVIDNGPGLDPAERAAVLERWARGDVSGGTGLGLSIVRRYAEVLDARFEFEAGPLGRGLRAAVTFAVEAEPTGG